VGVGTFLYVGMSEIVEVRGWGWGWGMGGGGGGDVPLRGHERDRGGAGGGGWGVCVCVCGGGGESVVLVLGVDEVNHGTAAPPPSHNPIAPHDARANRLPIRQEEFEGDMRSGREDISQAFARWVKFFWLLLGVAMIAGMAALPDAHDHVHHGAAGGHAHAHHHHHHHHH
jgi:hypothetical protein